MASRTREEDAAQELQKDAAPTWRDVVGAVRWPLLFGGFLCAYLVGVLGAWPIKALGWWEQGGAWERDMLAWTQETVTPTVDWLMLTLPLFGTNYTLVPIVAFAAVWIWRPPGAVGTVLLVLLGAFIGAGAALAIYAFVVETAAPRWLLAALATAGGAVTWWWDLKRRHRSRNPGAAIHLVVIQVGSWILNPAIKFSVPRPRPELFEQRGQHGFPAYPSGHSIAVMAVMFTAAYLLDRMGYGKWGYWVVGAFFLLNSYSRVYLSVHWPTDIFGGAAVGLLWLLAGIGAFRAVHRAQPPFSAS